MSRKITLAAFVVLIILKVLILENPGAQFRGFNDLSWSELQTCENRLLTEIDANSEGIKAGNGELEVVCESTPFSPLAPMLRLHYAYKEKSKGTRHPYVLDFITTSGESLGQVEFPNSSESSPQSWNALTIDLEQRIKLALRSLDIKIKVSSKDPKAQPLFLRDRIEFLTAKPIAENLRLNHVIRGNYLEIAVTLILLFVAFYLVAGSTKTEFVLLIFGVSLALQFAWQPFFYYDEWHVVQRFSENPFFKAVLYTHNEHFLPVFFSWLYLEMKLLGGYYPAYLFINCILLAAYAYVIYVLIKELSFKEKTARVLALLFCVSSLHTEAMQWAFEQSIILSSILGVLLLINGLRFIKNPSVAQAATGFLLMFISPLVFGGGFAYYPITLFFILVVGLFHCELKLKVLLKRLLGFSVTTGAGLILPILWYTKFKNSSAGHAVDESSFFSDPPRLFAYFFQGISIGSILRPLGFYPFLSLKPPQEVLSELLLIPLNELQFSIWVFVIVLILLLFCYVLIKYEGVRRAKLYSFILLGLGFVACLFILFAAGRWRLGANQSLALRYQVQALPGFLILIAPLIQSLLLKMEDRQMIKSFAYIALLVWTLIQVIAIEHFAYFKFNGDVDRLYITAASEMIDKNGNVQKGSPYVMPLHVPGITPGRGMPELVRSYQWLND